MTTSEFIKMLQDADPSGNAHIRMEGGVPIFAELKAGYWDGPYSYIDEDGNYVYSTEGNKVDIHCRDVEDFVEYNFNIHDPNNLENVKSMFKFKLTYSFHNKEKEESFMKNVEKEWHEYYEVMKSFLDKSIKRATENSNLGWTWFQNKEVDNKELSPNLHHYYTWKVYDETGKDQGSNPYNVEAVYKSGLFERLDNNKKEGYYEWVIKK